MGKWRNGHRWWLANLAVALGLIGGAQTLQGAQSSLSSRSIPKQHVLRPMASCAQLQVLRRIETTIGRSLSIEIAPEDFACWRDLPVHPEPLTGDDNATLGETLNGLFGEDARYEWRERDGVIVVRPIAAWHNAAHFLDRPVRPFSVADGHLADALDAIAAALPGIAFGNPDFLLNATRPLPSIQVTFRGGTVLEALNAIVRSRDDLGWKVIYCGGLAERPAIMVESIGHGTLIGAAPGTFPCAPQ